MSRRLTPGWRLHATVACLTFPPLLHLVSLERLAGWIGRRGLPEPDPSVDDASLAEWVDRVLRRLPPPWRRTCLKRALVLHYLLRRAGRPAELRIGVRRDERKALAAHAWLVKSETPYLERGEEVVESFQVLATFPSHGERDP